MYLGIEQQTGLVYEGLGGPEIPSIPASIVTHAKLIEKPEDWNRSPLVLGTTSPDTLSIPP